MIHNSTKKKLKMFFQMTEEIGYSSTEAIWERELQIFKIYNLICFLLFGFFFFISENPIEHHYKPSFTLLDLKCGTREEKIQ